MSKTNNGERQQNLPITQQIDIRKKQVEVMKKKSEIRQPRQHLFLQQPPSPGKYRILQRRENGTNLQPSKNSKGTSAEDRSIRKQQVKEVLKFIQNTMQI